MSAGAVETPSLDVNCRAFRSPLRKPGFLFFSGSARLAGPGQSPQGKADRTSEIPDGTRGAQQNLEPRTSNPLDHPSPTVYTVIANPSRIRFIST